MTVTQNNAYRSTESKYKGGASEMYISYDLEQQTRGGNTALMPKIKRVYIAGEVKEWKQGDFCKRSGREVHGVRIEYQQSRSRYRRRSFHAKRDQTDYHVAGTGVRAAQQRFAQVVELPASARNVAFHRNGKDLPERYRHALQRVR